MPRRSTPWVAGIVPSVALVFGCYGDHVGSPNFIGCYVDGVYLNDFVASWQYDPVGDNTEISGLDRSQVIMIVVTFPGNATGTWTDPAGGAEIMYRDAAGTTYWANDLDGSYTIDVTTYEPVGGRVVGTFSADVVELAGPGTHTITGSFNVLR